MQKYKKELKQHKMLKIRQPCFQNLFFESMPISKAVLRGVSEMPLQKRHTKALKEAPSFHRDEKRRLKIPQDAPRDAPSFHRYAQRRPRRPVRASLNHLLVMPRSG